MLRKVRLYGKLAKFVGHRVLEADVHSAAEAIRFLITNWPGLESHMSDQYYKVFADKWEVNEEEFHYPTGSSDIRIVPVVGGAGGSTTNILLGVAMIGIAVALPGAGLFAGGSMGFGATVGFSTVTAMIGNIGIALVLYGVAQALTPVQQTPETVQDPKNSFSFSGTQNTSRAGVPVPICYGEILTGSIVISAAVDTVQVEV